MPVQAPPPQEYARIVLILILLFFLYTSPDQPGQPGFISIRDYAAERIERSRHSLDVLNRTGWQDFSPEGPDKSRYEAARYLNLTGFRAEDGYAWDRLEAFKKRSLMFGDEAKGRWRVGKGYTGMEGEIYENVT